MKYVVTVTSQMTFNVEAENESDAQSKAVDAVQFDYSNEFCANAETDSSYEGYDSCAEDLD